MITLDMHFRSGEHVNSYLKAVLCLEKIMKKN